MTQRFLNTTNHSIAWVYKRHQADELELKASFQRNPVWSDNQKSYLIDTILNGFPIPEIYIQEFTSSDGQDRYVVVDGQQRLRACIDFLDNKFSITGEDSREFDGLSFDDLTPDQKQIVYNYNFVVRKLPEMTDPELRSIFRRLNRNVVALNTQELRHSTYWGGFIALMEELANDERWAHFGIFTSNDVRRMLDVEYISELAIGYIHGPQNKKTSLDRWYAVYEREFEQKSEVRTVFNSVLGEISAVLPDLSKTRWRKKSDFYTLFIVMSENVSRFPLSREERADLASRLVTFGAAVNAFTADPEMKPTPTATVRLYTGAVERAASDLASRKTRATQLRTAMGPTFLEPPALI